MAKEELSVETLQHFRYEPVCVKTGGNFHKWVKQTFTYAPPWVYILMVLGLLAFIIVYMIVRKQAVVYFPAVKGLQARRNLLVTLTAICLLAGLGFVIATAVELKWGVVGVLLLVASVLLGMPGMDRVWIRGSLSKDGTVISLRGAHPEFLLRVRNPSPPAADESTTPTE